MIIITTALGIVGSILLILSALSTDKKRLVIFNLCSLAFLFTQMLLTESYVGLGAASVSIVRSIFVLKSFKNPAYNHWLTVVAFVLAHFVVFSFINDWSDTNIWNFAPVIGSSLSTIAIFFKNLIYTKAFLIGAGVLWLFYEFQSGAYGQMVGESFGVVSNSIALVLLIRAAITHTPVFDPTEAITLPISTIVIPAVTKAFPKISDNDLEKYKQTKAKEAKSQKSRKTMNGVISQSQLYDIDNDILTAQTSELKVIPDIVPDPLGWLPSAHSTPTAKTKELPQTSN